MTTKPRHMMLKELDNQIEHLKESCRATQDRDPTEGEIECFKMGFTTGVTVSADVSRQIASTMLDETMIEMLSELGEEVES